MIGVGLRVILVHAPKKTIPLPLPLPPTPYPYAQVHDPTPYPYPYPRRVSAQPMPLRRSLRYAIQFAQARG